MSMTIAELEMENTALRLECKKLMVENENLSLALKVSNVLREKDITDFLVEAVVKSYHEGKDLKEAIDNVKNKLEEEGKLKFMVMEFKNVSKEQLEAEGIFRERGVS